MNDKESFMNTRIGFLLKIVIVILVILSVTGCWNSRELDTLAIVMGIGFDKAEEPGKVQMVAQIGKPAETKITKKEGGSVGGSENAYWNIKNTGNTVFSTVRGAMNESSRKLYFPHNQVLILSQDVAKEGIQKYIDFFVRDHENRLEVLILVSKGKTSEIFDVKSELEKIPAINIAKLVENQSATSQAVVVNLKQFITSMMSKTTAPVAPFIEVVSNGKEKTVLISGTAVFKQDRLVGYLDRNETRGLLWATGGVKSGIVEVDCPKGNGTVSIEILRTSSKIIPEIKGNKMYIKVKVSTMGNIGDQSCSDNLALPTAIAALEQEEADLIRKEIMAALTKAQELNADIFGFSETVHQQYPSVWKEVNEKWEEIFPSIGVDILVEAKIRRTGKITKTISPE